VISTANDRSTCVGVKGLWEGVLSAAGGDGEGTSTKSHGN
jgi:hypothetical protein